MVKYSPYDNVTAQNYPSMLVEVSLNDSQVPYWEGTKLVAKLRATKTDTNVLLLKANMGAGTADPRGVTTRCGKPRSAIRTCCGRWV